MLNHIFVFVLSYGSARLVEEIEKTLQSKLNEAQNQ